jgi:hypothetical protein
MAGEAGPTVSLLMSGGKGRDVENKGVLKFKILVYRTSTRNDFGILTKLGRKCCVSLRVTERRRGSLNSFL